MEKSLPTAKIVNLPFIMRKPVPSPKIIQLPAAVVSSVLYSADIWLLADGRISTIAPSLRGKIPAAKIITRADLRDIDIDGVMEVMQGKAENYEAIYDMRDVCNFATELAEMWLAANPRRLEKLLEQLNTQKTA